MECKKCKEIASVTLRNTDHYCVNCFTTNVNHKFRSCLGKNRVLSNNDRVLIGVSGGLGSMTLLNLVFNGVSLETHKKLRISPTCTFITGLNHNKSKESETAENVIKLCSKYGFDVYVININEYFKETITLPPVNIMVEEEEYNTNIWRSKLKKIMITDYNDLISKIKSNFLIRIAKDLKCNNIFTGETTTTLASSLLSNVALGRGSQVEHDVGFCDARDNTVRILRPMKDITMEELKYFSQINNLSSYCDKDDSISIQSLIKSFVVDLQDNFPATISTICKTADKIGTNDHQAPEERRCTMCLSTLKHSKKLTALEATEFSKIVCSGMKSDTSENTRDNDLMCYSCKKYQECLTT